MVHCFTALFVWRLVLITFSTPFLNKEKIAQHAEVIALLAGLVFVSHPIQTEAVTYIWQRCTSLAALFYVAALCFYIEWRLNKKTVYYACALVITVLGMFTKENTITLPLMIVLYEISFFDTKTMNWKYLSAFLLTLLIIPLTIFFTHSPQFQGLQEFQKAPNAVSPWHYLLTQFRVITTYIRLLLVPINQNIDHDYAISKSIFEWPTMVSFLFLAGILYAAIRSFAKWRLISFSLFWFLLTLSLESSVLALRNIIFEHRLYLPLAGYSLFLVSGIYYLLGKNNFKMMVGLLVAIITFNSILAYQRNNVWKDELTLWNDAIRKSPHKARPFYNRAYAYYQLHEYAKAIDDYKKTITLSPPSSDISVLYIGLGLCRAGQGRFSQAIADYYKAIELKPQPHDAATAYLGLGLCHAAQGHLTLAVADYQKAITEDPDETDEYYNLGLAHYRLGDLDQSIMDYSKVIEIDTQFTKAYINRGISFHQEGKIPPALADFNKAIEIDPNTPEAYYNRGLVYHQEGNAGLALSDYNKAIQIKPDYAQAYINRGSIYLSRGNLNQALSEYNQAIEIDPSIADAYYDRGSLYHLQGNLTQALSDYEYAIDLNPDYSEALNNRAVVYYQLKEYAKAWKDVRKVKSLKWNINPNFINALKNASGI